MKHVLELLPLIVAIGCAPPTPASSSRTADGGSTTTPPPPPETTAPPPADECGGASTSISGVVTFPSGALPVSKAQVYVPVDPSGSITRSGTCGECVDRSSVYAITETGVDGTFNLAGVPSGTTMIVVQKGPFVRNVPVSLTPCTANPLDGEQTRLPRDSSEGTVPRIAVVTGTWDHMETVLQHIGLSSGVVDIVNGDDETGSTDGGASLFRDSARLNGYDYVFVDCGAGFADSWYDRSALEDPAVVANIRSFVEEGGRLYVTDLAYDTAEAAVPSAFDFGGASGLSDTPEPIDAAENGAPIYGATQGEVLDEELAAWLANNGALDASGMMEIRGLEEGWVMVQSASAERAKTWVRGPMSGSPHPLTVTADRGCGRTLFTSYHTVEGASGSMLTAQEQALAYLILEIGNCVEEPTLI